MGDPGLPRVTTTSREGDGLHRSIADLLRPIGSSGQGHPDGLDLYVALVEAWDPLTAPLLARGGRTRVSVLRHLQAPSAADTDQIDLLRAVSAQDLVGRAVDEARFIGSPTATSRHLVLAAVSLVDRPELSDLRHLTRDLEEAEATVAGASTATARPDPDWFAPGRRRRHGSAATAAMRGARLVSIERVDVRSTRTVVAWRLTHLPTEPMRVADVQASDDVGTTYIARVVGRGWERGQDREEVFGETVLLPAVPSGARRLLIAAVGMLPDGRDERFPGCRKPFETPVLVEVAIPSDS